MGKVKVTAVRQYEGTAGLISSLTEAQLSKAFELDCGFPLRIVSQSISQKPVYGINASTRKGSEVIMRSCSSMCSRGGDPEI